jgi:hypothetical protein
MKLVILLVDPKPRTRRATTTDEDEHDGGIILTYA